mgnify:CR=1 FL=1
MGTKRLDKFLSETANVTRKEAKVLLSKGKVFVNGELCKNGDSKVSETDEILLDGKKLGAIEEFLYLMLHKQAGVVSATEDKKDKTVLDVVREQEGEFHIGKRELFPVGRLDKDTEGLLLLTDDGELAHRLLSPKRHVDKIYYAKVSGIVPEDAVERFANGISVGKEYEAMPAKLEILNISLQENTSEVQITLREGKFHQVKRMCHEIGCEVTYLKRLSMGSLQLDNNLPIGKCRKLTEEEIQKLKEDIR